MLQHTNLLISDLPGEIWKTIEESPYYQISNYCRIKAIEKIKWGGKSFYTKKAQIRRQHISKNGYWEIGIECLPLNTILKVHRLYAKAFKDNPHNYPVINHIDGNKLNNELDNLEWTTQRENILHAFRIGLTSTKTQFKKGDISKRRKKIVQLNKLTGEYIKTWDCLQHAVDYTGLSQGNMSQCLLGKQKTFGGYRWLYLSDYELLKQK